MSEIAAEVARGIHERDPEYSETPYWGIPNDQKKYYLSCAEVALFVAEPHLRYMHRQELLDELIAASYKLVSYNEVDNPQKPHSFLQGWYFEPGSIGPHDHEDPFGDWLKAWKEAE